MTVASPFAGRKASLATALLLFAVIPPLTAREMPGLIEQHNWLLLDQALAGAIAAMSLNLLLGYAGQISLGHAGLLGMGAFVAGNVTTRIAGPMPLGWLAAVTVSSVVALLIGVPALRLRGLYLAIVTVLFALAMQYTVFPSALLSSGSAGVAVPRRIWGTTFLTDNAWFAVVCLVLLLVAWVVDDNLVRTKVGRAFRAIKENEPVAQSFGIDVTRYKLLAFVVSGAMAGLAGALYGQAIGHVDSDLTFNLLNWSLPLVIMVVVGGAGHRLAVIMAAILFVILPSALGSLHYVANIVGAVLLLLTVSRHPEGLADLARQRWLRRSAPAAADETLPQLPELPPAAAVPQQRNPGAPVLDVVEVTVRFGGLLAVDRVTLSVPAGTIVGLIGPNGAGKSTLFNAVSGLVKPESGSIRFRGEPVHHLPAHQRARLGVARSFQQIGLVGELSVRENLLLAQHQLAGYGDAAAMLALPRAVRTETELRRRAAEALETLGFADRADQPVRQLSGGQQRIVEIACLLLTAPDVLLLDEPSAGMAPGVAEGLAERLRDLRDRYNRTVLLIEHNVPIVMDICDYVYVLDAGRVVAEGDPDAIASNPRVVEAYFGAAVPVARTAR